MPDQTPQWPFMPAIQGQVPMPRPDPRSAQDKSLAFAKALMGAHAAQPSIPLPRPDPRNWSDRAVMPQIQDESASMGAIHPDTYLKLHGVPAGSGVDANTYTQSGIDTIMQNNTAGSQRPFGEPDPGIQRGAGLFGVPAQHLQQMAGDVVQFPMPLGFGGAPSEGKYLSQKMQGDVPAKKFDPAGDMTGGGKVLRLPWVDAANRPPKPPTPASGQNLPQIPTSGFEPSLSPNYFSSDNPWTNRNQQPGAPPTFWQPG